VKKKTLRSLRLCEKKGMGYWESGIRSFFGVLQKTLHPCSFAALRETKRHCGLCAFARKKEWVIGNRVLGPSLGFYRKLCAPAPLRLCVKKKPLRALRRCEKKGI
jgi:hypothetical protein